MERLCTKSWFFLLLSFIHKSKQFWDNLLQVDGQHAICYSVEMTEGRRLIEQNFGGNAKEPWMNPKDFWVLRLLFNTRSLSCQDYNKTLFLSWWSLLVSGWSLNCYNSHHGGDAIQDKHCARKNNHAALNPIRYCFNPKRHISVMLGAYLAKVIWDGLGFFERDGIGSSFFYIFSRWQFVNSGCIKPWWNGSNKR